jgi:hypothetical protein
MNVRFLPIAAVLLAAGCSERSLATAGDRRHLPFQGELPELEVLAGVAAEGARSDASQPLTVPAGATMLLVQYGVVEPDPALVAAIAARWRVLPVGGTPGASVAHLRRIAGAGGAQVVLVCWGTVETQQAANAGAAASWIPIAGMFIDDTDQTMRVRLKAVLADVATGTWAPLTATADASVITTSSANRQERDAAQIRTLTADAARKLVTAMTGAP